MHSSQTDYRELFDSIHAQENKSLYLHVLAPWVEAHSGELGWLRNFASRRGEPIPPADVEELWRLYALSRVNQMLLLGFQNGQADGSHWSCPSLTLEDYQRFAESLGLTVTESVEFSPFFHEIVEVEEARDEDQPVMLESTFWPCVMLGKMVFSRAGVRVIAGRRVIRKEIAKSSTLYWAFQRRNRPSQDLSHGWGSNSQWRTCFRRDYQVGQDFHYNVDGKHDLASPELETEDRHGLTREERIELLVHRCFVKSMKPHDDLWPYDDRIRVSAKGV